MSRVKGIIATLSIYELLCTKKLTQSILDLKLS